MNDQGETESGFEFVSNTVTVESGTQSGTFQIAVTGDGAATGAREFFISASTSSSFGYDWILNGAIQAQSVTVYDTAAQVAGCTVTGMKLVTDDSGFETKIPIIRSIEHYPDVNNPGAVFDHKNKLWMMVVQVQLTGTNLNKCKVERWMHFTFNYRNGAKVEQSDPPFAANRKDTTGGVADHPSRIKDDWVNGDGTQRAIGDTPGNGGVQLTGKIHAKLKLPVGIWRPGLTPCNLQWNYYIKVSENGTVKAEIWYDVRTVIPEAREFTKKERDDKKDKRGREVVIEANETARNIPSQT